MFDVLNIHNDGDGPYRVNRYRIYFRVRSTQACPTVASLASDFNSRFKFFFEPNIATVSLRSDKPFGGVASLQFKVDAKALYGRLNIPDIHTDWVGVIWSDNSKGFAVQTLERDFMEREDRVAATAGALAGSPAMLPGAIVGGYSAVQINQHHFLAGRRSWIIASAHNFDNNPSSLNLNGLFVLETAAIERFSLIIHQIINVTGGALINDYDKAIDTIWTTLLRNYVRSKGFQPVPVQTWVNMTQNVTHISREYEDKSSCAAGTHGLRRLHSHLWP